MEPIKNLFDKVKIIRRPRTRRSSGSERGECFDQILSMLNTDLRKQDRPYTHARLGYMLQGVDTPSLYALISKMRDGERRGIPAGAIFWTETRPPKKP